MLSWVAPSRCHACKRSNYKAETFCLIVWFIRRSACFWVQWCFAPSQHATLTLIMWWFDSLYNKCRQRQGEKKQTTAWLHNFTWIFNSLSHGREIITSSVSGDANFTRPSNWRFKIFLGLHDTLAQCFGDERRSVPANTSLSLPSALISFGWVQPQFCQINRSVWVTMNILNIRLSQKWT